VLLVASEQLCAEPHTRPHIESAHAFWTVQFVGGEREEVHRHSRDIDRDLARGLRGIDVQGDAPFPCDLADPLERENHARFVVGVHHAE